MAGVGFPSPVAPCRSCRPHPKVRRYRSVPDHGTGAYPTRTGEPLIPLVRSGPFLGAASNDYVSAFGAPKDGLAKPVLALFGFPGIDRRGVNRALAPRLPTTKTWQRN